MTASVKTMEREGEVMDDREGKYLTFSLAAEEYGISILKVKEIIGVMSITMVPQTPAYVKGVINLRTANISAAGAFFLIENPLPEGTKVNINIFFHFKDVRGSSDTEGHIVMKVTGRVLRSEPTGMAIGFNRDYDVGYLSKFIGPGHC